MNITEQISSKSVIDCDTLYYESFILYATLLYNSCWIQSDDGTIAAFIVPIVAIILVQFKLQLNCNKLILLQINCIFLVITLKVLWQRKTMNNQYSSNKITTKYGTVLVHNVLLNQLPLLYHRSLPKAVIILLPLLGATWIIGIFAVNNETQVFAWIFAILNSLQVSVSYY